MKPHLSSKQLKILTQALVILSSLDYCNSLYYGINASLLAQLQSMQTRACRIVYGLKNKEYTSHHMKNLHWLKVKDHIKFKTLLLIYKTLNGISPEYTTTLINYNHIVEVVLILCHQPSTRLQVERGPALQYSGTIYLLK